MQKLALARSFEQWTSKVWDGVEVTPHSGGSTSCVRLSSFAPLGLGRFIHPTHGLRRGLHSYAASRLLASPGEFRTAFDSRPGYR
jgi:hypothetical protein